MIHEDEEQEPIDFSWIYFIGMAKLNLSIKEIGRLTMKMFLKLYRQYKDTFDLEMRLRLSNTTYAELEAKIDKSEEWF